MTDNKLSFFELSHCNIVKGDACAWRMLHVLEYHTVDYEHRLANEFAIYFRFGSEVFLVKSTIKKKWVIELFGNCRVS